MNTDKKDFGSQLAYAALDDIPKAKTVTDDEAISLIDELTQIIKILSKSISTMNKNRKK